MFELFQLPVLSDIWTRKIIHKKLIFTFFLPDFIIYILEETTGEILWMGDLAEIEFTFHLFGVSFAFWKSSATIFCAILHAVNGEVIKIDYTMNLKFPLTPMGVLAHRLRTLDRSLVPPSA